MHTGEWNFSYPITKSLNHITFLAEIKLWPQLVMQSSAFLGSVAAGYLGVEKNGINALIPVVFAYLAGLTLERFRWAGWYSSAIQMIPSGIVDGALIYLGAQIAQQLIK